MYNSVCVCVCVRACVRACVCVLGKMGRCRHFQNDDDKKLSSVGVLFSSLAGSLVVHIDALILICSALWKRMYRSSIWASQAVPSFWLLCAMFYIIGDRILCGWKHGCRSAARLLQGQPEQSWSVPVARCRLVDLSKWLTTCCKSGHARHFFNQCDIYKVLKVFHWNQSDNHWSDTTRPSTLLLLEVF